MSNREQIAEDSADESSGSCRFCEYSPCACGHHDYRSDRQYSADLERERQERDEDSMTSPRDDMDVGG